MSRPLWAALAGAASILAMAARPATQSLPPSPGLDRFTVSSDGHPMAVWARLPASSPKGAILLVHGMTWSSRPDFDLQVPGMHRSVMADLAAQGIAAYAVDLRGYGETPRDPSGWLTPNRAAADVANVLAWIAARHPALPKPALLGWSRGAMVAHLTAQLSPARMSAVILFGYVMDPDEEILPSEGPADPPREKTTREDALEDFISPKVTPTAVVDAFVDTALRSDPVRTDWKSFEQFNVMKPDRITVPLLLIHGEHDPGVPLDLAGKFFADSGNPDRQWVILPGADHCAQLEDTHDAFVAAVAGFLSRPGPTRR